MWWYHQNQHQHQHQQQDEWLATVTAAVMVCCGCSIGSRLGVCAVAEAVMVAVMLHWVCQHWSQQPLAVQSGSIQQQCGCVCTCSFRWKHGAACLHASPLLLDAGAVIRQRHEHAVCSRVSDPEQLQQRHSCSSPAATMYSELVANTPPPSFSCFR
jgi:hypothetical protein